MVLERCYQAAGYLWITFHLMKRKVTRLKGKGISNNFRELAQVLLMAPVFAFAYCLICAYTASNQHGMYTHCGVNNFALSVSEAIAKPEISRVIWTISIVVHSPVLLFFSLELTKFYVDYLYNKSWAQSKENTNRVSLVDNPGFWKFCLLAAIFTGIVELGSLLGLTFVTSHSLDYFAFHQVCVGGFLFAGASHMTLSSYIEHVCSTKVVKISQRKSLYYNQRHLFYANLRRRLSVLVCLVASLMFYLYYRHNRYCEPYMYSMFCITEYLVIIFIMMYHNLGPPLLNQHRWQKSSPCWSGHQSNGISDINQEKNSFEVGTLEEESNIAETNPSDNAVLV